MNILAKYDGLLELSSLNEKDLRAELWSIFKRDFDGKIECCGKDVEPTPSDSGGYEHVFIHLITKSDDKTGREIDRKRSKYIHWIKPHIKRDLSPFSDLHDLSVFSIEENRRTSLYLLNKTKKYVVILELKRDKSALYLLTAFPIDDESKYNSMINKEKRAIKQKAS